MNLPAEFEKRMQRLLGEEYPDFLHCYEKEKKQGLRVNTGKISVEEFLSLTPFQLTPIPWVKNGFFYREEDQVTKHPHYYAGLYYIQEPSAMVPASRLPVEPGDRVLDLCAAPGGKATELGARLAGEGLLVANDVSVSRARGLQKNLELFGIANALVTAETPGKLLEKFGCSFDKILVDAPCSGEGMFRKDPSLIRSWEERGPEYYAPLQKEILSCAVQMVKPGGQILYSTCTFSPEEDEEVILQILREYPELVMEQAEGYEGFCTGILPVEDCRETGFDKKKCIRIWPHKMEGEGHFTVLLRKNPQGDEASGNAPGVLAAAWPDVPHPSTDRACDPDRRKKGTPVKRNRKEPACCAASCKLPAEAERFLEKLSLPCLKRGRFFQNKEELFLLPEDLSLPGLRYLRTGLYLGTVKRDRFEPSQALAMALKKQQYKNVLDLPWEHPAVNRYLKGETLELEETQACQPGWVLVCCDGYPLGWGKCVNGTIRNKYQPGWRMQ